MTKEEIIAHIHDVSWDADVITCTANADSMFLGIVLHNGIADGTTQQKILIAVRVLQQSTALTINCEFIDPNDEAAGILVGGPGR